MKKLKRIGVGSLAKTFGAIYGAIGFIVGLFFMIITLFGRAESSGPGGTIFGIGAPIFLGIFYGAVGLIGGLVTAWLYNLTSKFVGGVEIEVE